MKTTDMTREELAPAISLLHPSIQTTCTRAELLILLDELCRTRSEQAVPTKYFGGPPSSSLTVLLAGGNLAEELNGWRETAHHSLCVGEGGARQLDTHGYYARHLRALVRQNLWNFDLVQRGVFLWRHAHTVLAADGYQFNTAFRWLRSILRGDPVWFEDDGEDYLFDARHLGFIVECGTADAEQLELFQGRLNLLPKRALDPVLCQPTPQPAFRVMPSHTSRRRPSGPSHSWNLLAWVGRLLTACRSLPSPPPSTPR